ncbi:respiratory nitrate reductase subunit gamma [Tessaracoccus sp. ZS01]|uniref:respiratory nitrate reductase subunit gamma n=1 Tax=Tessaracoccus sp. ZS01 TaxID=1906324 RepID=UPI00096C793E|nr:respiratory nitrate reductase subunit gamma [Tessaracoccus sp. ZS01]MCG6567339.1 respiratory nitrate reductase subunit gamma [Tessaracoccus sp. ZS01]OMG57292.1 respiratory nitrate reductase subunit gamma [Tessaracoccus sp. ZS01]
MNFLLWGVLPYVVLFVLVGGLIWRYKFDQFGWTTRSSQMYESKMLKVASPLFHFALIAVLMGHLVGLLIPKVFTDWVGLDQHTYHLGAYYGGGLAGLALVVGLALLIWRRRRTGSVFAATTWNDKIMYLVLATVIGLGMVATLTGDRFADGTEHNYRETVSIWFRSLFVLQPDVDAMAASTWQFQTHVVIGLLLFAITPFTRLVHAFSAPFHYLFRPYIVYRTRATSPRRSATRTGRGWDPVGTRDNEKTRR